MATIRDGGASGPREQILVSSDGWPSFQRSRSPKRHTSPTLASGVPPSGIAGHGPDATREPARTAAYRRRPRLASPPRFVNTPPKPENKRLDMTKPNRDAAFGRLAIDRLCKSAASRSHAGLRQRTLGVAFGLHRRLRRRPRPAHDPQHRSIGPPQPRWSFEPSAARRLNPKLSSRPSLRTPNEEVQSSWHRTSKRGRPSLRRRWC